MHLFFIASVIASSFFPSCQLNQYWVGISDKNNLLPDMVANLVTMLFHCNTTIVMTDLKTRAINGSIACLSINDI